MRDNSIAKSLAILGPSIISRPLAMDVLLPCVPAIALTMNASAGLTQWVLSIYFIASGVGQLFLGPLTDKYGRRIVLLFSTLILTFSSLSCAFVDNIYALILLRFIQGLGGCGASVVTMAIVRDIFDDQTTPKVYSYCNAIIALAPTCGPLLGSNLLLLTGDWRTIFYFVSFFCFVSLTLNYFFVTETRSFASNEALQRFSVLANYKKLLTDKLYLVYCLYGIVSVSSLFIFYSSSGPLLIDGVGLSPHIYAYYFALYAAVYLLGNILSPKIQQIVGMNGTILYGSISVFAGGIIMLLVYYFFGLNPLGLVLPNLLVTLGVGFMFGPCTAGAINRYKNIAGIASACFAFFAYGGSGLLVGVMMHLWQVNAVILGVYILSVGLLSIFCALKYLLPIAIVTESTITSAID